MRALLAGFAVFTFAIVMASGTNLAQDKKEEPKTVVIKGKICCAKCELGVEKKCMTVIVSKDEKSKKDVTYYFDKTGHGKFHDDICSAAKNGSVEGTVKDADKKKTVTVKKVTYE
jgi:hypothetical protein